MTGGDPQTLGQDRLGRRDKLLQALPPRRVELIKRRPRGAVQLQKLLAKVGELRSLATCLDDERLAETLFALA